jgi:acetate kinase
LGAAILCLNAGSSSLKFALFRAAPAGGVSPVSKGQVEGIGTSPHLVIRDRHGALLAERRWPSDAALEHEHFLAAIFEALDAQLGDDVLLAVGHRVVHGGAEFANPVRVDAAIIDRLGALSPLAPLHQPHNLAAILAVSAVRPDLPQVACFDTAFHQGQPEVAKRFALTRDLEAQGVRRYGFHGLSYEYVARRLAEIDPRMAQGRVIAAHLGAGASLCALAAGRSVDSTMGFTAVDGLMMGTRCGSLDPGVILYLMQHRGYTVEQVEALIYRQSGLLGVSGLSSDMRTLLASADPRAEVAVALFLYRLAREAGALVSVLGGLDGLIFTAGIGENAPQIRAGTCARLSWLGVEIGEAANAAGEAVISTPSSRVKVRVIPTDEEQMVAVHTLKTLGGL